MAADRANASPDAASSEERLRATLDALRESEERCRSLVSQLKDYALFGIDRAGRITSWNEGVFHVLGYNAEEFIGMESARLFTPEELARGEPAREFTRAAERGSASDDRWMLRKDGERIWATGVTTALRNVAGELIGYSKVMGNRTDWKRAYDALRHSERMLAHAQEVANAGSWEVDLLDLENLAASPARWSDQCYRILGYEPGAVAAALDTYLRHIHPEDRPAVESRIRGAVRSAGLYRSEHRIVRRDGVERIIEETGVVDLDTRGRPIRLLGAARDITELNRARIDLRETADREHTRAEELSVLMDAVPAAVWITRDPDCRVVTGNRTAYRMLRMPEGANMSLRPDIGQPVRYRLFRDGVELEPGELPMEQAVAGRDVRGAEGEIRFEDGSMLCLHGDAVPLRDAKGRIYGAIGAFIDITERKEMEQRLRDVDRRKDEFLAMLSHELRNPLAPVRNAARILKEAGHRDAQLDWAADVIDRQVLQLARLVDDLLDVARIAQGKLALHKEWTDLGAIFHRALEVSRPLIDARRHSLKVTLPAERVRLEADPGRLAQVLSNLLNNAAKFTGEGGLIELAGQAGNGEALIRVRDNGPGIGADELPRIFDLFAQTERAAGRAQGGLGIGLTIVRSVVEMHGGRVNVYSAGRGKGTEFVVSIPLRTPPAGAERPAEPAPEPKRIGPQRVLVVDDNVDAADSVAVLLRLHGHEVETVHDGRQAIAAAVRQRPGVILLDIGLPGMSGYEVARELRARPETRESVLVALTGYGQAEDIARSREAGFNHHLVKPVDPQALERLLASSGPENREPATPQDA